ncbi:MULTISPECIES: LptF/LptG family permease [unclassified Nitratiruptor]|uniref:LptF/LptG family permease n=1 Tax=unclassified Nitratiruptor TaxID=2624044 RepID=UPI0019159693|nr:MULTISPECIES: LptF/LptG family permease [unclassified Nitratiruptor]BCD60170.1 lipopolysaccharide export system permease protein [Nitratiruptor sp. YY08-10]BCD64342.1 lipopolysaccharide export system permease protein [Nitratiruptor sp. YY08-14]
MPKLLRYLGNHLYESFLSYFLPLFSIASLIFFIKIVSLTSIVQLSLGDLAKLYIFITPQILFFTVPVVFFIAAVTALHKLSFDYETIAFFSLGISPVTIMRYLTLLAVLLSMLLSIVAYILIPQGKQLEKGFYRYKKTEANINLKPSEYGHKFGSWFVYVQKKDKNNFFKNVVLYNFNTSRERFITSQKATFDNSQYGLKLTLYNGNAYTYKKGSLDQISFKKMDLFDTSTSYYFQYIDPMHYWEKAFSNKQRAFDMLFFLWITLLPILGMPYAGMIGIHHPRYHKGGVFLKVFLVLFFYFGFAFLLSKTLSFFSPMIMAIWFFGGIYLFHKTVMSRY